MAGAGTLKSKAERLVIGLSGASGVAYGIRALEACRELGIESHLVMTKPAEMTIGYETRLSPRQVAGKADYAYAIGDGAVLQARDLPPELLESELGEGQSVWVSSASEPDDASPEKRRIREVLERTGGNRERAAKILGLSRVTLWRRMKHHGLVEPTDGKG